MISQGVQNADAIIETCKKTLAALGGKAKPEWKETLNNGISAVEDLRTKFFMKTNFAIPVTNACLKDASELQSVVASGNLARFPEAISRFETSIKKLIEQSKMDGAILT